MNSVQTTFEEARRCPKCETPGSEQSSRRGPYGSKIHTIVCMNERCKWYNTTWVVQVHQDGTVQPPTKHDKSYPKVPDMTDRVNEQMQRLYEQSLNSGETR